MVPQAYLANKISRDSLKQTTFKTILCYSGELAALLNSAFLPCLFFFYATKAASWHRLHAATASSKTSALFDLICSLYDNLLSSFFIDILVDICAPKIKTYRETT